MKIEFEDGTVFEYVESLHVTKGDEVDIVIAKEFLPVRLRDELEELTRRVDGEISRITRLVTDAVGKRACILDDSEDWSTPLGNLDSKFPAYNHTKEDYAYILDEGEPFGD